MNCSVTEQVTFRCVGDFIVTMQLAGKYATDFSVTGYGAVLYVSDSFVTEQFAQKNCCELYLTDLLAVRYLVEFSVSGQVAISNVADFKPALVPWVLCAPFLFDLCFFKLSLIPISPFTYIFLKPS